MLDQKHCVPCEGGVDPYSETQIATYLPLVPGWEPQQGKSLTRTMKFKNFKEALTFINKVGEIAEAEGHHPDINLHDWNIVTFTFSTHAIGGLSENDFILAAKINALT